MSACLPFRIYLGDQAIELIVFVRSEIVRKGGSVSGTNESGGFQVSTPVGSISATYVLDGTSIEVTITSKPRLVSCAHIQDKLTDGVLDAKAMLRSRGGSGKQGL